MNEKTERAGCGVFPMIMPDENKKQLMESCSNEQCKQKHGGGAHKE